MSAEAWSLIGVKVTAFVRVRTLLTDPSCEHPVYPGNQYCAACGQKYGTRTRNKVIWPVEGFGPYTDEFLGWDVIECDGDFFVGECCAGVEYSGAESMEISSIKVSDIFVRLRDALVPHGMWDETTFKLWTLLKDDN